VTVLVTENEFLKDISKNGNCVTVLVTEMNFFEGYLQQTGTVVTVLV
jgi:hypothetical protein